MRAQQQLHENASAETEAVKVEEVTEISEPETPVAPEA